MRWATGARQVLPLVINAPESSKSGARRTRAARRRARCHGQVPKDDAAIRADGQNPSAEMDRRAMIVQRRTRNMSEGSVLDRRIDVVSYERFS